jgi:hypothetical protein
MPSVFAMAVADGRPPSSPATRCRLYRLVRPYKRGAFAYFLGVPHDLQAGQQFHITCRPASLHVPDTLRLVDRVIFRPVLGQGAFCRMLVLQKASLSRPPKMENRAAASQVGARSSLGGPSATATATCNPSNTDVTAIVLSADIVFPLYGPPQQFLTSWAWARPTRIIPTRGGKESLGRRSGHRLNSTLARNP